MRILTCILLALWNDASSFVGLTCAHCLNAGWFACLHCSLTFCLEVKLFVGDVSIFLHCSLESYSDFAVHCQISAVLQFKTVLAASCPYLLLGGASVCRRRFDLPLTILYAPLWFHMPRALCSHIRTYSYLPLLTLPSVKVVLHEIMHKWGCCLSAKGELLYWFCAGEVKGCRGAV